MKKVMLLIVLNLGAIDLLWSQKPDFKITEIFPIENSHSYVGFSVRYMGYAMVRGRFTDFRGSVRYDQKDLTKTSVTLMIKAGSIDTSNEWRDNDLKSDNWFGAEKYPKITFISKRSELTPQGLLVTGDLTIRGITKTISIPMTYPPHVLKDIRDDSQIVFAGTITLNRIDFGVEGKNWAGIKEGITAVSDDVNVELTILGKRINAGNFKYWVANPESPHGKVYSIAKNTGVVKALEEFETLRAATGSKVNFETLNTAGQMLLKQNNVKDALVLFKRNITAYHEVSTVYESYGEALATQGDWSEASKYYKLALEKDPDNINAQEILRHIK